MEITFENVGYTYQPNTPFSHTALKNVSFQIPAGSFTAIVGHTGSGKSTLIQHLNGLAIPTEGKVTMGKFILEKGKKVKNIKKLRSQVGVVFQYPEHQLFEETIEKDIAFGPENFGVSSEEIAERIKRIIPAVGLTEAHLKRSPFDLSGGQMRRVAIAGVLAVDPQVLVLDEPTAGLDPRGQKEIMDMFSKLHYNQAQTTILVTHSMEDALKYADHVIILNQGTLYMEGKPKDVFVQKEALQKVNLDVPELVSFLVEFETKFGKAIPFTDQSLSEVAESIQQILKEVE